MTMVHPPSYFYSKYSLDVKLGEGTFGCVYKAFDRYSGQVFAIKVLKDSKDVSNLNEKKILWEMKNHPNIIQLKEVATENGVLRLVFEYMDGSLLKLIEDVKRSRRVISEFVVRNCCFQVLKGLDYMHKRGYFHRDLKPENLLISKAGIVKIADLGSATEFKADMPITEYISTRWYRAPEVLLQSNYGPAIDMWAMGAIMAELFLLDPLFPGARSSDQLYKICSVIGSPTSPDDLSWLGTDAELYNKFPQFEAIPFPTLMRHVSKDAFNLMTLLLSWNPSKRPTAAEALRHPFFKPCYEVQSASLCSTLAPLMALGTTRAHQLVL
ncbi:Cyclin-dependent kinase f-4 [Thalictrum thalictroides]|uniref:Cyclin-dependent kinase f-4 n=1 Tax=Thalictrum thalictroides TaxID=46969 RepID=A0A7J6VCY5_THATH|nr:Cyclin-dependent kinase f-4 [Thalictrum thalictroides]